MALKRRGTDSIPFGRILKKFMDERRLTVRAVAEMAGVRSSVVQGWCDGSNPHDLLAVERLAKALGVGFKQLLLGGTEASAAPDGLSENFDRQDLFDGVCQVTIKRLIPKVKNK